MPPCSLVIRFVHRQSLLFDITADSIQPSSLRPSSLPSPLYFHFHRHPSYVVLLSSHHMPIPLQPSFLDFLCDFPQYRCPIILSFLILSSLTSSLSSAWNRLLSSHDKITLSCQLIYTIILLKSVCLLVFANCRSQFLLDRLGRCL